MLYQVCSATMLIVAPSPAAVRCLMPDSLACVSANNKVLKWRPGCMTPRQHAVSCCWLLRGLLSGQESLCCLKSSMHPRSTALLESAQHKPHVMVWKTLCNTPPHARPLHSCIAFQHCKSLPEGSQILYSLRMPQMMKPSAMLMSHLYDHRCMHLRSDALQLHAIRK